MKIKTTILALLMIFSILATNAQITWNCGSFTCSVPDTNVVCNTNSTCILNCTITNLNCCGSINVNQVIDSVMSLPAGWSVTMCNPNGCFGTSTTSNAFIIAPGSSVSAKFEVHSGANSGSTDVRVKFLDVANSSNGTTFHIIGSTSATGIADIFNENSKYLTQNYPNPFIGSTKIRYTIPTQKGKIVITDISGKQIQLLSLSNYEGTIEIGDNLSKGVYFYSLMNEENEILSVKKMIVQ